MGVPQATWTSSSLNNYLGAPTAATRPSALTRLRYLILDMDGVLWRGNTPMPGLADFFAAMRRLDIGVVLATNNATKTVNDYVARLAGFGVDIAATRIITSATATASYLQTHYPPATPLYVVGEPGLRQILRDHGFILANQSEESALAEEMMSKPAAVVAGLDRRLTYQRLAAAALHIQRGAAFFGTNPDVSLPHELGELPGAGAILAALQAATGVEPVIIGKPGAIMFQEALRRLGAAPEAAAMVGDRLETDVVGGKNAGIATILLLSGVTQPDDLPRSPIQPDFIFANINALAEALIAAREQSSHE